MPAFCYSANVEKDILSYCERLENAMQVQNQKTMDELRACRSENWNLQAQLQDSEAQTDWLIKENEAIRVWTPELQVSFRQTLRPQNQSQNAYVFVIIDGNGLLV